MTELDDLTLKTFAKLHRVARKFPDRLYPIAVKLLRYIQREDMLGEVFSYDTEDIHKITNANTEELYAVMCYFENNDCAMWVDYGKWVFIG